MQNSKNRVYMTPEQARIYQMQQALQRPPMQSQQLQQAGSGQRAVGTVAGVGSALGGGYLASQMAGAGSAAAPVAASAAPAALGATGAASTIGAGTGAAGVGSVGGAGASAAPVAGVGGAGMLPMAGGIAAGGYTGYQQLKGVGNALKGNKLSLQQQAALALPTFGLSFAANKFMSGKDKDQKRRDAIRSNWQKTGGVDENYGLKLADGSTYDIGKDGGAMLTNTDGKQRHAYDVDFSRADSGSTASAANALAYLLAGGDEKGMRDTAGYITNAAQSKGDVKQNLRSMYQNAGWDHDKIYGQIHLAAKSQGGNLDDATADAMKNALDELYGVGAYRKKKK